MQNDVHKKKLFLKIENLVVVFQKLLLTKLKFMSHPGTEY